MTWPPYAVPEPTTFNGDDHRPDDRAAAYQAEEAREALWASFEQDILAFAQVEGWPATLRAVSRAMQGQKELWR